jgi:anti-sigma B factor antagonist
VTPVFECTWSDGGVDAASVRVAGELDIATAPALERTLLESEARARRVVLDLRELEFVDCWGVHVIVRASARLRTAGGRLVIVRGRSYVDRTFALTKTSELLEIVELGPAEPPVQALVELVREDYAA